MRRQVRKVGAAAVAVVTLFIGVGASNAATTIESFPPDDDPQLPTVGGIFVRGDSLRNQIRVGYDAGANEFVLSDSRRPVELRMNGTKIVTCRVYDRHFARCANPEPGELKAGVTVRLRGGPDFLLPKRSLRTPIAANGGPGVDEVNGARGDDVLKGGPATDVVRGLDGDDNLIGGPGDKLYGGDGDDVILADHGTVETTIDCGAGEDRAYVDADDAETFGCERVVR